MKFTNPANLTDRQFGSADTTYPISQTGIAILAANTSQQIVAQASIEAGGIPYGWTLFYAEFQVLIPGSVTGIITLSPYVGAITSPPFWSINAFGQSRTVSTLNSSAHGLQLEPHAGIEVTSSVNCSFVWNIICTFGTPPN